MSLLFCEYLCNERSDLYEILNLSFYVSNKLPHKSLNLKLHKDPRFCCRDICKTILTFKNHEFSMYFAYFHIFAPPKYDFAAFFSKDLKLCYP